MEAKWLAGPNRSKTRFGESPLFKEGLYQLTRNAYAWMVPNGSWGETNIGLVDCGGQSLLVDTFWDLHYIGEFLEYASVILTDSPVEKIVNTHSDGDHCWGNQLFKDKEIIASQACAKQMHQHTPSAMQAFKQGGKLLRHIPVRQVDKLGRYMSTMFSPYQFDDVIITDPSTCFEGSHEFNLNGVDIVVTEVGPGHTDGDAIVYIPSQDVAYAGDILFIGVTPVMWSGPLDNLLQGIEKLRSLNPKVVVPGHGPLADAHSIQTVIDYWHFAHEQLHARFQQDKEPHEAALEVLQSRDFAQSVFATWDSPERMVTNAYTLYRHWGASVSRLPEKLGVVDLFRRQAQVAFKLPHATPACMHKR